MEITKERIKELAAKNPSDRAMLERLLPEVFEDEKSFNFSKVSQVAVLRDDINWPDNFDKYRGIQLRDSGEYALKGFYLYGGYNWEIVTDSSGIKVLIPTKIK